jgi:predicted acylesterase/phospholipase RssA
LFDIVAGTSIGAINVSITLSYFVNNNSNNNTPKEGDKRKDVWNESVNDFLEF